MKCEPKSEVCDAAVVDVKQMPLEEPVQDPKKHDKQCHQCNRCGKLTVTIISGF